MSKEKIDAFVAGLQQQLEEFIAQNDLIPHGHHYDWSISFKRYREELAVKSETYMNGPKWEASKEQPTDQEWDSILALPCFDPMEYPASTMNGSLKKFLAQKRAGKVTMYVPANYPTAINKLLEEAGSEFRFFRVTKSSKTGSGLYRIR